MEETPRMEEGNVSPAPVEEKKESRSSKASTLLVAGLAVAVVVGGIIWYVVGLQSVRGLSESSFTLTTARIFKLPVASVNGEKVPYTEYVDNLQAMRTFYDTETELGTRPTDAEMSDYILSRLLVNHLVEQVAAEFSVSLEQSDIDAIIDAKLLPSFESREKAEQEIMRRYGWTLDEFVQNIVVPTELEQKLSTAYLESVKNPAEKEAIKTKAQEVLDRIKKGESFEKLAKEFSSDSTAEVGGDLKWFAKGAMVPEFESAVFALKKGELAENLVETKFGYHIIRLDDRRTVKGTNGEDVEQVRAHHILFKTNEMDTSKFGSYMNQRLLSSEIKVSKGLRNPFEEMGNSAEVLETEDTPVTTTTLE